MSLNPNLGGLFRGLFFGGGGGGGVLGGKIIPCLELVRMTVET